MATCAVCGYEADGSFKFCPECGAAAAAGREQRKVVTVLFCDVVGSTELGESRDAEAVRALLAAFFQRVKAIVERHGGVVEKFIGDAVMAVFGLPVVHEDDALRALRAATEIQAALPGLGIRGRIGVTSGEVVTGTEERLATGDAVNVAARLQGAAEPGEILLGEATLKLARDAVEAEPLEPLALKGKREPVPAWRLLAVSMEMPLRRLDTPLIGRERELDALVQAWERARADGKCELVTVVGSAGVGKSRLVEELLSSADATVVRGRCLSYGEGVTYWPVVAVVKQLEVQRAAIELDPAAEDALSVLLGEGGTSSTDAIAWGFRKLLEAAAAASPLVVVFDDIHWGEDVFLDLLEHVAFLSSGSSILLLCVARPELLDRRSGWGGVVRLEPLPPQEAEELMKVRIGAKELDPDIRRRILQAAGGNPLFVEEMAAMILTTGDGQVEVPPTIQALLASRLDQLDAPERSVLERGAVEGELFHQGAVSALTPDEPRLTTRLTALVRKEFVRPDRTQLAGTDAFRFRHLLVRDAAYDGLPKADRAELHERFAEWLDEHGRELVELDELVGYHLEQAYRYLDELGRVDEHAGKLAVRSGERLAAAGSRAVLRNDFHAGLNLLERAADLLPFELCTPRFEMNLAWARFMSGDVTKACAGLVEAADRAGRAGHRIVELALRLEQGNYELMLGSPDFAATQRRLVDEALPIIEADGDEWALTVAVASATILGQLENASFAELVAGCERVLVHARRANDPLWTAWAEMVIPDFQRAGDTPVEDCFRWLDEHPHVERSGVVPYRDRLLAMLGRFDEAHARLTEVAERASELGAARNERFEWHRFDVASLEGQWTEAEMAAQRACVAAEANQELANYMLFCSMRAQALVELGRPDEALESVDRGEELAPSHEAEPQVRSRFVRARILASRDQYDAAEALAREAVARAAETDMLNLHGEALLSLAEVLALAGKDPQLELQQALTLYERKGNLVMAERTSSRLTAAG